MRISIFTPAPPGSLKGNRVTALRWAGILRGLGHRVEVTSRSPGRLPDLLVALHARRSFREVDRFRRKRPGAPVVVALTGTDLYHDFRRSAVARRSLEWATRIVVLQRRAPAALPGSLRRKARVIYQSAKPPAAAGKSGRSRTDRAGPDGDFPVCLLAHLRPVKDPFRAALAARLLPRSSRIRILHLGSSLGPGMARRARAEMARNPRYLWLGERPRPEALRILSRSRLLLLTSRLEGGANAISEALAASVPVLATRIPGSTGILGRDYPGCFPVGDAAALASLLHRAETDRRFRSVLERRCRKLRSLVDPARERRAWKALLGEMGLPLRRKLQGTSERGALEIGMPPLRRFPKSRESREIRPGPARRKRKEHAR